jgi:hypothetical protein
MFFGALIAGMGFPHFGQLTFDVLMPILPFRFIVPTTMKAFPTNKPKTMAIKIEVIIFSSLPTP